MVQVNDSVGSTQNGSMKAVSGSGMASMSEASMLFQPRMLEPSKPKPSEKISSVSSRMGQLKCCQVPKVSTNLMSIILAPLFLANSITLLGVLILISAADAVDVVGNLSPPSIVERCGLHCRFASLLGSNSNHVHE